VKSGTC